MKLRTQLHFMAGLILFSTLCVFVAEAALWVRNNHALERRNYVALCLKDVFELNLLTHEMNLYEDISRPIDQMNLKLQILIDRFQQVSSSKVFSSSEIIAVNSTLQAIHSLLALRQEAQDKRSLPEDELANGEFYDRIGSQLLQRAQTLYGAFSLMRDHLVEQEAKEEFWTSLVRSFLWLSMCGLVGAPLFFLFRHVVNAFTLLEAGTAEVAGGNIKFKFPVNIATERDEIGAVKSAFNTMVFSLGEAASEIQKKNKELETLLYVISHDLKEPLRAVEYFSDMVYKRYAPAMDLEAQDYLRRTTQGAVRLGHLIDDILTLSKARKVTIPDAFVPTKVIIKKALERLEQKIKTTEARVDVAEDLPELKVEPTWAMEAVYNLVSNALKYTRPGEKPQIEIAAYRSETAALKEAGIIVQDRGPGVSPEMAQRIFNLFQRGVGREIEGSGAGLAIVKAVVERHGGRTWVEPREGGGSRFIITFKT